MASVNSKLNRALSDLVDGNIWALSKPVEENPKVFIVYNPEIETPEDFGDDEEHEWLVRMQVHWYADGQVNYLQAKRDIRSRLKAAGFTISEISMVELAPEVAPKEPGTGYTHICFYCNIPEDEI